MKMKIWEVVVVIGTIIFIFGNIFHLQGQSIVGPESSFMYANPEWVTLGFQILIVGIGVLGLGFGLKFKN